MSAHFPHLRAVGFALAGFALWVLSDTSMKLAGESALPPYEIVTFLGAFGVLFMILKARCGGDKIRDLWPRNPSKQLGRAFLALMINLCNALAFKHISLTLFYVTVFTAPIFISLLATVFLHEKLNRVTVFATLAGFLGVVVAINPFSQNQEGDWIGYAATLSGVAFFAANSLWLRVMTQSETPDSIAFFASVVETVLGFAVMLFHAEPVGFKLFLILAVMGFFSLAGNVCYYVALKHAKAATVAQFHYTQIIIGSIIGYIIWHEVPTWHLATGAIIIIASGILVAAQRHTIIPGNKEGLLQEAPPHNPG